MQKWPLKLLRPGLGPLQQPEDDDAEAEPKQNEGTNSPAPGPASVGVKRGQGSVVPVVRLIDCKVKLGLSGPGARLTSFNHSQLIDLANRNPGSCAHWHQPGRPVTKRGHPPCLP